MAEISSDTKDNIELYNAAAEVAKNLIYYFRLANLAMQNNDLKYWWVNLDSAYMEADFSFKEEDRIKMEKLWNKIDPNLKSSFGLLKEYHLELRKLCKKFFTMGETKTGPAIWRR